MGNIRMRKDDCPKCGDRQWRGPQFKAPGGGLYEPSGMLEFTCGTCGYRAYEPPNDALGLVAPVKHVSALT